MRFHDAATPLGVLVFGVIALANIAVCIYTNCS